MKINKKIKREEKIQKEFVKKFAKIIYISTSNIV